MKYTFDSKSFTHLAITAKKTEKPCGFIRLIKNGNILESCYYKYNGFETYTLLLIPDTQYILECLNLEISLAYAYDAFSLLQEGVTYLRFTEQEIYQYNLANMQCAYNQKFRNQFHFSPFCGWMNDPNGLCWYKGYYHMFYQFNPNSDRWENMHWGHSASKDLIHWIHLPVAAYPQIELLDNPEFRGGAFSGSAIIEDNIMHLFYTRHFGKVDRSWQRQWQVSCQSIDGISFSSETSCIWGTPEGVFFDFRDPKIIPYNETYIMVLGGTCHQRPSVLWYCSENLKDWKYQGVLMEEEDPKYGIAECPDFFYLDGKYILLVGYIYADKSVAERRDSKYYVGTFDGKNFFIERQGLIDYGKDFYAAQTLEHNGRRIMIGWNTTGEGIYVSESGCANGTASIPREISLGKELHLCSVPILEMKSLLGEVIYDEKVMSESIISVGGPYYMRLNSFLDNIDFSAVLVSNQMEAVTVSLNHSSFCLTIGSKSVCQFDLLEPMVELEIYVDCSLVEIFINKGMYTCTRRFYITDADYSVRKLSIDEGDGHVTISSINTIW